MTIRTASPPNRIGRQKINHSQPDYDVAIFDQGYRVVLYEAVRCPCNNNRAGALSTCQNCLGLGWVFINPIQTQAIITSLNKDTKYKYWSQELEGTVALTLRNSEKVAPMDKVVLKDMNSHISELRPLQTIDSESQDFIFTTYPIVEVEAVFLFNGIDTQLKRLDSSEYSISSDNPYVLKLNINNKPTEFNESVSIKYKHRVQYNVVDLPHDIRFARTVNSKGKEVNTALPIQAVARKTEYLNGLSLNYDGSGIIDNSFL